MKIELNSFDLEDVENFREKYHLSPLSATVMARRRIKESDVKYYLEDDIIYQHSPFTVDDVYTAIERIEDALDTSDGRDQEKIIIFGDRDVDGITATAIMYKTLKKLGAKYVDCRLPHQDEGYGLSGDICREIIDGGYTLCITVDNGISAIEEIKLLEKSGVDVIVLDHHIPLDELPPALAIFCPKVEGIGYPFDGLAGCAVAAKMCWALHFARTPLFNSSVILLHAEPGNETIRVDAVKVENLVAVKRISDDFLTSSRSSLFSSPLFPLLSENIPIVVLDKDTELTLLRKAFGSGVDIALEEFRGTMERVMPSTRSKTLFDLALHSRSANYGDGPREIETLLSLFRSVSIHSYPQLSDEFEEIQVLEAIGTIADLMPLLDENRLIVRKGLSILSKRPPESLAPLLSRQNLIGVPLTVSNVSFKITPVLNASGRMGEPETALSLLLSSSPTEIEEITQKLLSLNTERQKNEEKVMEAVLPLSKISLEKSEGRFIIVEDDSIPRGLTGAIASKLSNENSVPSIVLATTDDVVFGSLRCSGDWNAKEFLSIFSHLYEDYGGHRAAAGLRMMKERKDEFIAAVYSYVSSLSDEGKEEKGVEADAIISGKDLDEDVWKTLKVFQPFGQGNEELRFYLPRGRIREAYHVGNNARFMRLSIECGGYIWPSVWWNAENTQELLPGREVSLIFSPEINWWRGSGKEQLNIKEIELLRD